jgi:HTH-type transcriptional regulator / antitoxin HigA
MSAKIENEYAPLDVSPPGLTLEEALEERGMSQAELSERAGRPKKTINEIIRGQAAITPDTAIQLERVLGIPASFWNTRQQQYDESRARAQARLQLDRYLEWPRNFPLTQMSRFGWIPRKRSAVEKVEALLRFFQVASPEELDQIWGARRLGVAFRKSTAFKTNPHALQAWIRQGEVQAALVSCKPFDRRVFETTLGEMKDLVRDLPETFNEDLVRRCAECGVAVVFVPLLSGVHAWGATRWLNTGKAMILLSLRGRYEDIFWFSFYHEAGHILLHGKRDVFVEENDGKGDQEQEADAFAAESLVPPAVWKTFVQRKSLFSEKDVKEFAAEAGISQAIVVGRLQHEGRIESSHLNDLRRRVGFAEGEKR